MRIPTFGSNPKLTAVMPSLSGGLNTRAGSGQIADTELQDADNLYWEDGQLRTRDGWVCGENRRYDAHTDALSSRFYTGAGYLWQLERRVKDGGPATDLVFYRCDADGTNRTMAFSHRTLDSNGDCVCMPSGGKWRDILFFLYFTDGTVFGIREDATSQDLTDEIYEPLRYMNGEAGSSLENATRGTAVEGYNRLTARFRCAYTNNGGTLYYALPSDTVSVVSAEAYEMVYPLNVEVNGVTFRTDGRWCWFERYGDVWPYPPVVQNGIVIHAIGPKPDLSIGKMRFGTWYGGTGDAQGGGRLFMSGNPDATDTVVYSAAADPLYFPVDNYIQVGSSQWAVTAFGRQHGDLIVFKENEIYAATYVKGETVDVEAVQSGLITDLHAASAVFPVTLISADTGCDLPDTVAVYDGALTFACGDGTVYALCDPTTTASYRLKRLNDAVSPSFTTDITIACAAVWRGRYCLIWDKTLWLYDGRWYRWSWPQNGTVPYGIFAVDNALRVIGAQFYRVDHVGRWHWFCPSGGYDTDEHLAAGGDGRLPVVGRFRTKSFDFGTPETYKAVTAVAAEIHSRGAVTVSYLTEEGTRKDRPVKPNRGGLLRVSPNLSRLRRLALEIEGEGLTIGAVTVAVKGGMK